MNEHELKIHEDHEKKMAVVILFTIFAMIVEIYLGRITKSMSLLAEGYHMGIHVLTLGLTYIAYILVRKFKNSEHFKLGTYKIGILAGYTSALLLGLSAVEIIRESVMRFIIPEEINFTSAVYAAVFALVVNFICIAVMEGKMHVHSLEHTDETEHKDYNFRAAFYHILSDILVSVLTIISLVVGKYTGLTILDPITGIIGALLIVIWAYRLLKHTVKILIDMT